MAYIGTQEGAEPREPRRTTSYQAPQPAPYQAPTATQPASSGVTGPTSGSPKPSYTPYGGYPPPPTSYGTPSGGGAGGYNPYGTSGGGGYGGYPPPPNGTGGWGSYDPYYQGGTNPYGSGGQPPAAPGGAAPGGAAPGGAAPPAAAPTTYSGSGLEGFDLGKLNDPTHQTAKYTFARLASKYSPNAQGYAQLMQDPEFQRLGFQSLGNGNIRLPNGEVVDVMRGFQSGGHAWQWGTSGAVEAGQAQALPKDYAQQYGGYQPGYPPPQPGYGYGYGYGDPNAAYFGYGGYPPPPGYGYTPTNQPVQDPAAWWAAQYPNPATTQQPQAYTDPYQGGQADPYAQYGGYYPPAYGYGAPGGYGGGYSQGVGVQAGQSPAVPRAVGALAQGMYPPGMFGSYYGF